LKLAEIDDGGISEIAFIDCRAGPESPHFLARLLLRTDRQFDNPWRSSDHTIARGCPNESALFPAVT
jgi:hypothetical protein